MVLNDQLPYAKIFEAGSINEATQNTPDGIDLILLDINLQGLNGLDGMVLLKRKWARVPVIVLSSQDGPETIRDALGRGAVCFMSKADSADKIVDILNHVLHGEYATPETPPDNAVLSLLQHLTPRQCEVLDLLCQGMSNKLIARRLALSENTVRGHVQAILGFLQVSSRSEAAFAARQRGLIG